MTTTRTTRTTRTTTEDDEEEGRTVDGDAVTGDARRRRRSPGTIAAPKAATQRTVS
jgi:hypothetical protein